MIRSSSITTAVMLAISLASIPMTALASDRNTNPQSRVITTNICIDSLVVALIGTKNLVAVSALADDDRYSHISDKVKNLQKVAFNAEMIYALDPSLVLASNFSSAKTKSALEKLGINVSLISFARSVEDIEKNIFILGELLNAESQAQELASLLKSPKVNTKHVKQVIALQYSTNRFVHGHNSLISSIIRRSGFKSYSEFLGYNEGRYISAEALVKSAPDVLILDGDKSFSNKSGSTLYHPALLKGKSKTKALFIETKHWSCGTPKVVDLITRLSSEYIKLVSQNNAS
ncbi:ABC transporter substrate-binding protein [Alphaproteobacteria bacterium]|nr:ABC transporter substrate-binding protein [Alphaproteobacteria bacterium]